MEFIGMQERNGLSLANRGFGELLVAVCQADSFISEAAKLVIAIKI